MSLIDEIEKEGFVQKLYGLRNWQMLELVNVRAARMIRSFMASISRRIPLLRAHVRGAIRCRANLDSSRSVR